MLGQRRIGRGFQLGDERWILLRPHKRHGSKMWFRTKVAAGALLPHISVDSRPTDVEQPSHKALRLAGLNGLDYLLA